MRIINQEKLVINHSEQKTPESTGNKAINQVSQVQANEPVLCQGQTPPFGSCILLVLIFVIQAIINYQMLTVQEAVNLSHDKMQGCQLSSHQDLALSRFMKFPPNLDLILLTSSTQPNFMACFKAYTQEARRSADYFSAYTDPSKTVQYMLSILCGAPDRISQHQSNVYLSLEGELLASLVQMRHHKNYFFQYLQRVLDLNVYDQIKYHYVLKIMACCFEETANLFDNSQPPSACRSKTKHFSTYYAPVFVSFIDQMAEKICHQFEDLYDPLLLISDLQQAQEQYLSLLNRHCENEEETRELSSDKLVLKIFEWEECSLKLWVECHCRFAIKIIKILANGNGTFKSTILANSVVCNCLGLILHICQLAFEDQQMSRDNQLNKAIREIVICELLNFFFDQCTQYFSDHSKILPLSSQTHAKILKIIMCHPDLLTQFIRGSWSQDQLTQNTSRYVQLQNYSMLIISSHQIEFIDFSRCPVGLSVKLMHMITVTAIDIFAKSESSQADFQVFSSHLNKIYDTFFVGFVFCKLVMNKNQNQQLYEEEKDWPSFVAETLNAYFQDLLEFLPNYFHPNKSLQYHNTKPVCSVDRGRFFIFSELQENQRANKMEELVQQFQREEVFEMLCNMFFLITFQQTEIKKFHQSSNFKVQQNQNFTLYQIQQSILFANMLPQLSCFITILTKIENYQIKAFFYYQIYQFSKGFRIGSYAFCKNKARLCKLYLIQAFLDEILREQFLTYGQEQSVTYAFLQKELGVSFEALILEAASNIRQCLQAFDRVRVDFNSPEIVDYGLSILQRVCKLLTGRVGHLRDHEHSESKQKFEAYDFLLQRIFYTLKDLNIECPVAYRKLFAISGYFIDLNGVTVLYNIYEKLQEQTLEKTKLAAQKKQREEIVQRYLSGVTGILESLFRSEVFRAAAELFMTDIYYLKKNGLFDINEDLMEIEVDFLNCLICQKIYGESQDSLGLLIHDLFIEDLPSLISLAEETGYEKNCMNLYRKMTYTNQILPLASLSSFKSLAQYPDVLNQYFLRLPRVPNLLDLEPYAFSRIDWLFSFIEEKIQRNEKFQFNIEKTFLKFRMQKYEKIQQLLVETSAVTSQPIQNLKKRVREEFSKFDDIHSSSYLHPADQQSKQELNLWK